MWNLPFYRFTDSLLNALHYSIDATLQYLMEFNSSPGDLMELSPLFSDDSRVAEAASVAQKLRKWIYLYDITILCFL